MTESDNEKSKSRTQGTPTVLALKLDPMFDQAARALVQNAHPGISLLQRELNIGFDRASRLIEQMNNAGILDGRSN